MRADLEVFNDADMIETQTRANISNSPLLQQQVAGGAITNIAGAQGQSITITGSAASGWTISGVGTGSQLTFSLTVTNAATARTGLGLGGLAVLSPATNTANSAIVAGAAYSQTDFQSVIDTLNNLLTRLRTAGIQA